MLHRREMLIAMLGLPAVLAGCDSSDSAGRRIAEIGEPDFPGRLVGPSVEIGHRLRDGWHLAPPADAWQTTGVVIIGGGVAGLSAAWRLRQAGCEDFVVVELEPDPGGTSRGGRCGENSTSDLIAGEPARGVSAKTAFPWGAHYVPAPTRENPALVKLFGELGLFEGTDADGNPIVAEQYVCRDPAERLFYRGRWYEGLYLSAGASADDLAQRGRFDAEIDRWVAWRDGRGRRAFTIPIAAGSADAELAALDRISMADWLEERKFTSTRLRWLVDYCCRDDYGLTADQASAWAGLFYFASRVVRPRGEARPLITWPGGNSRLIAHLADGLGQRLRLDTTAIDVIPRGDVAGDSIGGGSVGSGVDVVTVSHRGGSPSGTATDFVPRGIHAERVIFAAPQFLAPYVIQPYRRNPPPHVARFHYGSWLVANLMLRDRPVENSFPLAWDNVFYDSPSLGYVNATHQQGPEFGPTVLTYYYPFCDAAPRRAREKLLQMDWRDSAVLALADISRAHPDIRSLVERIDVMRWGHAMIRPEPEFMFHPDRRAAAEPLRGIHFANTDLSGVALFEEAFYHGVRAAEEVLHARGRAVKSIL